MKKIFALLTVLTFAGATAGTVVACNSSSKHKTPDKPKIVIPWTDLKPAKKIEPIKMEIDSKGEMNINYSSGSMVSSKGEDFFIATYKWDLKEFKNWKEFSEVYKVVTFNENTKYQVSGLGQNYTKDISNQSFKTSEFKAEHQSDIYNITIAGTNEQNSLKLRAYFLISDQAIQLRIERKIFGNDKGRADTDLHMITSFSSITLKTQ